jgi:hypothetical protein
MWDFSSGGLLHATCGASPRLHLPCMGQDKKALVSYTGISILWHTSHYAEGEHVCYGVRSAG